MVHSIRCGMRHKYDTSDKGHTHHTPRHGIPRMDRYRCCRHGRNWHTHLQRASILLATILHLHADIINRGAQNGVVTDKMGAIMKRIKITVVRITRYEDLMAQYENPIEHSCDMQLGDSFIVEELRKPEGMCQSAWETLYPFVKELAEGGGNFFDGWMKNPHSAMLSCNDGFRPVSFYVEVIE